MTSYRRRCDVITSHRRKYDVSFTSCARWLDFAFLSYSAILKKNDFPLFWTKTDVKPLATLPRRYIIVIHKCKTICPLLGGDNSRALASELYLPHRRTNRTDKSISFSGYISRTCGKPLPFTSQADKQWYKYSIPSSSV